MQRAFSILVVSGFIAVSPFTFTGCTTSETGRIQYGLIGGGMSSSQEAELGLNAFEQLKKEVPISKNADYNALVSKVGARIAEQAKSKLPDAKWEFVVFESAEANAFCLPGGKIGVYTGILPITKTEEGLATVLGHEVAHASNHHGAERMGEATAINKATSAAGGYVSGNYQAVAATAFGLVGKGAELAFSRTHESEADHVGLLYMARAGYNPEEAVKFWERFSAASKGQSEGIKWTRTHPLTADRIADLKKLLPEAKAAYKPTK
jgi:predicted Zn-dependent protease